MKKLLAPLLLAVVVPALVLSQPAPVTYPVQHGYGKIDSVSSTGHANIVFSPAATVVSVYNAGTNDLFIQANIGSGSFISNTTDGAAIPIAVSQSFTFDYSVGKRSAVYNLRLLRAAGSGNAYVSGY